MPSETIHVGPLGITFLIEGGDSNGSVATFECTVPAGTGMPLPHSHDGYEETAYGLSGTVTFTVEGERVDIGPGDVFCIPRGAVHAFRNEGDDDARMLAIVTPGVLGPDFFREAGAVVAESQGPPDPAKMGAVMRRHGLTPRPDKL